MTMNVSYDEAVNEVVKLAAAKFELRLDKAEIERLGLYHSRVRLDLSHRGLLVDFEGGNNDVAVIRPE